MRILLINTAGTEGSVALADTESGPPVVAAEVLPGRTSSERLVPAVRRLMDHHGWTLKELSAITVIHGPGSFTGVRVGLSAAKGFSEAANVPLLAISRLALLAACVKEENGPVQVVLDAGRGEFYFAENDARGHLREQLIGEHDLRSAALGTVVVSEAKVAEALAGLNVRMVAEPLAGDALPLALERIRTQDFDDAVTLDANYLRRSDAEIFAKLTPERTAR